MVATPKRDSFSTAALSARTILRRTMPRSFIAALISLPLCLQGRIEAREYAPRIAFEDLLAIGRTQRRRTLDVALGVVVVEAGLRIDPAHRADHFARKQHVVYRDHLGEQVDAGLVIDAGVEIDVVEEMILEQRLLHLLREATEAAPVVRRGPTAMGNEKAQLGEILEQ